MEISYNLLNLPSRLYGWGDYSDYYRYLADGTKILHEYKDGQRTLYIGSLVYDDSEGVSASFGGGRIVGSEAHYFLTDHLGSTRVVAKVTATGRQDIDRKDYYPFGKAWSNPDMPTSDNRYTFSGKEQQQLRDQSIHYADFGARFYDPDTGIFLQQDPLAEKVYRLTSYGYCNSNPINLVDPTGMETADEEAQRKAEQEANEWRKQGERNWREMMASAASVSAGAWNVNVNMGGSQDGRRDDNSISSAFDELKKIWGNLSTDPKSELLNKLEEVNSSLIDFATIIVEAAKKESGINLCGEPQLLNIISGINTTIQGSIIVSKLAVGEKVSFMNYANFAMSGGSLYSPNIAIASLYITGVVKLGTILHDYAQQGYVVADQWLRSVPQKIYNP